MNNGHCFFFTYLINNLSRKLYYCKNIDEVIDVFVDNICEFHSRVKLIYDSCICDLGNCQVRFSVAVWESTLKITLEEVIIC